MARRIGWVVVALLLVTLAFAPTSYADTPPKNKGLFITPLREYIDVAAAKAKNGTLTVINITDKPIDVTLSVEQFSVADYTYDYKFAPIKEDWVKLQSTQLLLQPNKSQDVPYTVAVPANATPGGHYFTIFATTSLHDDMVHSKVRAAMVLYVTVGGDLRRTSQIQKETIPWLSFGGDIPFTFDVQNTGNTHFFIYASGELRGWTAKQGPGAATHILLPGTTRTVDGIISAPLLPGVYTASYGYKTDDGQTVNRSKYIVYAPFWFLAIVLGVIWLVVIVLRRRKRVLKRRESIDSLPPPYK